jgi:hypothetical protein
MDFDERVVAVGLAREQRFEPALGRGIAQLLEAGFGLGDHALVALGFAQLDEAQRVVELALEVAAGLQLLLKLRTLAQQDLRLAGLVPQIGVAGLLTEGVEPGYRAVPVKDASSAARSTA